MDHGNTFYVTAQQAQILELLGPAMAISTVALMAYSFWFFHFPEYVRLAASGFDASTEPDS